MVRHSSYIELSQSALKKNLNFIRSKIGPHPKISSVVKANAYGHGIPEFVRIAERCGIDHFAVASAHEAEEVLEHRSSTSDIMIMGILYDVDIPWVIENGIEFYLFDYERLPLVVEAARAAGRKAVIHVEVETGCNRTGMPEAEFIQAITFIRKNLDTIEFQGVCTHLGGAETLGNQFKIDKQIGRFQWFLRELKKRKIQPKYRHVASSAATLAYPESRYDMVRVGIAQYGFWPSPDIYHLHLRDADKMKATPLQRVISWKTNVMHLKHVAKDEFVGYGTAFQAYQDMTVAVIPLGYSNGYSRGLSNRGHVLIHGKKAPIVGLINMNLFMVDVTHIPDISIGDEVTLIGRQRHNLITVSSFTNFTNQLNNEMLSRLPAAIPRIIVK